MLSTLNAIKSKATSLRRAITILSIATLFTLSPAASLLGGSSKVSAITAHYFTRHGICVGTGSFTGSAEVDVQYFQDTDGLIRMVYILITQHKEPSGANYDWATSATMYDKQGSQTISSWAGNPGQSKQFLTPTYWTTYTNNRYGYVHLSGGSANNECIVKVPAL